MDRTNETYVLFLIVKDACQNAAINHKIDINGIKIIANTAYELSFYVHNFDVEKRNVILPIGIIDTLSPTKIKELLINELS